MNYNLSLLTIAVCFLSCTLQKKKSIKPSGYKEITYSNDGCKGTCKGLEFSNGDDVAHQFSNTMSQAVGDTLKEL